MAQALQQNQGRENFETQKTLEFSPGKRQTIDSQQKKKTTKVIRKSVRVKDPSHQGFDQKLLIGQTFGITKSLDRVQQNLGPQMGKRQPIQININPVSDFQRVQESQIFGGKFQSTSTKNNGSNKIKLSGHEIENSKDLVYLPHKQQISANNSYLSIGDKMINANDKQNVGLAIHSNYGSGTNLQTMPIQAVSGGVSKPKNLPQGNQHPIKQNTGPHKRKQSIQHNKKDGPQINSQIDSHMMQGQPNVVFAQSKTTKNSMQYQIEPLANDIRNLNIQVQHNEYKASTGLTTMNNQTMVSNLKLKSQKVSQQKNEFNCLINTQNLHRLPGGDNSGQQQVIGRILPGKTKTIKANQIMVQNDVPQLHTSNNSHLRMWNEFTHPQSSIENLHVEQQVSKGVRSFNNTQGLNLQEILEGEDQKEFTKKMLNSTKKLNQTTQLNQQQLKQQHEVLLRHIEANQKGMAGMGNIGPYIIHNSKHLAQQVVQGIPNAKLFSNIHGSSSATNKAKKAFNFDLENQSKIKQSKQKGGSTVQSQNKQKQMINLQKGLNQQQGFINSNKNINLQNKQKTKTQMNLTGPLPKNILSPKSMANKSNGKSKHSQYFNNEAEVVQQNQQQYMVPQKVDSQQFNMGQMTPLNNPDGPLYQPFKQNEQQNQHQQRPSQQYQVQLNNQNGEPLAQPQITTSTQGCNTVININIDSNTFGARNHGDKQKQSTRNGHGITTQNSLLTQEQSIVMHSQSKSYNPIRARQTSSKMKRNESISSNKSKKATSNQNRRSNSGSQMRNQNPQQNQPISQLSSLNYNQPFVKNMTPKSNTDIIMNNIAKINQKLSQQEAVNYNNNGGQNLLININRMSDNGPISLNTSGSIKLPKTKVKVKDEPSTLKAPVGNIYQGKEIPMNSHGFNQTQKLAIQSNAASINPGMDQPMYSIIPKKGFEGGQNFKLKVANQTQKLTLKKVTKIKKINQANSQIGSARANNKGLQSNQYSNQQPMSQFYGQNEMANNFYGQNSSSFHNQPHQNEEMVDQLANMENQIQQNQIRLRNELMQMQNSMGQSQVNELRQNSKNSQDHENNFAQVPHHQNLMNGEKSMNIQQQYQTEIAGHPSRGVPQRISKFNSGNFQMVSVPPQQRPNRSTGNSVQGRQIKNPKMRIEDINIDNFMDQSQALNYISTKKSVSTKNQLNMKMQTQNVQNLLREAKREMVIDPYTYQQIQVAGEELYPQQERDIKFSGTQNLALGSLSNNFQIMQQPQGLSPQNKQNNCKIIFQDQEVDAKDFHSQGTVASSSTFGLGQINRKKQMIQSAIKTQDKTINQQHYPPKNTMNEPSHSQKVSLNVSSKKHGAGPKIDPQSMKANMQKFHPQKQLISNQQKVPQPVFTQPSEKPSMTGTITSEQSESDLVKKGARNSNMPPNSSINFRVEESDGLLMGESKLSELEPVMKDSVELKKRDDELQLPVSGAKVLKHYLKRSGLTEYEKSECLDFKQVYFLGLGSEKIRGSKNLQYNSGYDDERGDYNVVMKDQIGYRFEVLDFLGKGSFGQAVKCYDHMTQEIVAIKIIRNKKKFQHQAGVELKILIHLRDNDPDDTNNIIRIKDYCTFRKHLVISFELFSINLYEFIKNNNFEGVSLSLIRRFAIQILQALKYLREENLVHCDLKPENILLKSPDKSGIKVIDFGSSCFSNQRIYTYIQSRFYRAPEIILGIPYTGAIDMWSFGCILAELFTGVPIFPGESEQEQLSLIIQVCGLPCDKTLQHASRKKIFFNEQTGQPNLTSDSQGQLRTPFSKPLESVLMCQSDSFLDFIRQCLEWNPDKRLTPFDALMHDWIIEGLPPQVLVHHKKMLGIYESETEEEESHFEMQENIVEQSLTQGDQLDQLNDMIEEQDLSSSMIQALDDISIEQQSQVPNEMHHDQITTNNLGQRRPSKQNNQNIDFYGQNEFARKQQRQGNANRGQNIAQQSRYSVPDEAENVSNEQTTKSRSLKNTQYIGKSSSGSKQGILLEKTDNFSKNKTTNMSEILSQINKKSKSTKNNRQPIQYAQIPLAQNDNRSSNLQPQPNQMMQVIGPRAGGGNDFGPLLGSQNHAHMFEQSHPQQPMDFDNIEDYEGGKRSLENMDTESWV